jgi:hypothetical protein
MHLARPGLLSAKLNLPILLSLLVCLAPGTVLRAQPFTSDDIGRPSQPGSTAVVSAGVDLSFSGRDIDGRSDEFRYHWQLLTGDFDVQVRVPRLDAGDPWAKAGLMVRSSLSTNAAFAMVATTPGLAGSLFISRSGVDSNAVPEGFFPPNPPDAWIRLQRVNDRLTGYASRDARQWMPLGSASVDLPAQAYLGFALTSRSPASPATAQFRDFGNTSSTRSLSSFGQHEPPGPSSRTTGLAITEILYNPPPLEPGSTNSLEYVELFNSNPFFEEIGGYRLSGDVQFIFPAGTSLQGGHYLVIARDPEAIRRTYGIANVVGPFTGSLKPTGRVQLLDRVDAVMLDVPYSHLPPWPAAADGTGHSLSLARPSRGESFPEAWGISDRKGGSPGRAESLGPEPLRGVLINEFLANPSGADSEYLELYNHNPLPVDLSGAWLTDSPTTNKFRIPDGTIIPAGGFLTYDESRLGFSLNAEGETLYLVNANRDRVIDAVRFDDQRPGVSQGRHPDGNQEWYPLKTRSPGSPNTDILVHDVVIHEIMYKPISGDDDGFIELFNQGTNTLSIAGWKFVSGISFTFPPGATLPAQGYVVVGKNRSRLLSRYPGTLTPENTFGDYSGKPTRDGNRVALAMAIEEVSRGANGVEQTNIIYPVIDEVTFARGGQWGRWANGDGSSLELRDPRANHRLAANWGDSDETQKAPWSLIEATGLIDNSRPYNSGPINRLEVTLLNAGECLLDNVEVFAGTNAANRVSNSTFENGLAPWVVQGDHVQSALELDEGYQSSRSLHVRASARGDTGANRIRVAMSPDLAAGQTCTIRARARWLRGWPELILRLKGNGFELPGVLQVPTNLGTPGQRNTQAASNAPPAIAAVQHQPVLPPANHDVTITARVADPDGVKSLTVWYRTDPETNYTSVRMNDAGQEGDLLGQDGVFSGVIPGHPLGTLVAFYLEADDDALPPQSARFPAVAPQQECLIRFGEPTPASGFSSYHFWMTAKNLKTWINRPSLSNERVEGTFVYGNYRAIYNIGGKYSGSPYHQGIESPMTAGCNYSLELPLDDLLLGTENFNKIHAPGNGPFDDATGLAEQTAYWVMQQMDLPYNYRRIIGFYFNGIRKGNAFMEDTQTPGSDVVNQRFPDDSDGHLYKLQPWFEFDDVTSTGSGGAGFDTVSMCRLMHFYTGPTGNIKKLARYRYNWLTRAANGTANDYTNVWDLIDAANTPPRGDYVANMKHLVDMEEWMGVFAVQHAVGNWDSFGNSNAQNMYGYKPSRGKWTLLTWDFNIVLGNQGSDGPTGDDLFQTNTDDPGMVRIYETPEFRRMYLRSLKRIAEGPMSGNALAALMDAKYAEMTAGGIIVSNPAAMKRWVEQRQAFLSSEVKKYATNFTLFGSANYTTNSDLAVLTGSAPLDVKTVVVNGIQYPLAWVNPTSRITDSSYVTTWRILIPLTPGDNRLTLEALDLEGAKIPGMNLAVSITRTLSELDPRGVVVINEIHYNPVLPNAAYLELLNTSTNRAVDLSGWRLDGVGYTFPTGSVINRGQHLVLARDRVGLGRAFGLEVPVFGEYEGGLSDDGEVLSLVKPGPTPDQDIVVDRVRYEPTLPWPQTANGSGSSLQLVDATQDNSRVSNWGSAAERGWIKATLTATNRSPRILLYLTSAGEAYVDDVSLTGPDGKELVINGDFESPLAGNWGVGTNLTQSGRSTAVARSGSSSLHLISTAGFPLNGNTNQAIWQEVSPFATNRYTLTFWYLPSSNGVAVVARTLSTAPFLIQRVLAPVFATPGVANNVSATLPEYDELWLNEVLPYNVNGISDNQGDRDGWLELYNAGTKPISLADYFLTDDFSQLQSWRFPASAIIQPKEFLKIWADGEPEAGNETVLHTSFSLSLTNGSIALVRSIAGTPQIVDYLNYRRLGPDQSYGSFPDGQPFYRQRFTQVTPGNTNDGTPSAVQINEWMADNEGFIPDPGDGKFHDWFELYNPAETPADLSGFYLTDNLSNRTQYRIPSDTLIPPGGHLLVWADKLSPPPNPADLDLHASFNLSKRGGIIALLGPDGRTIDLVTYGGQTNDVSQGRFPDGAADLVFMSDPTPRQANRANQSNNTLPTLEAIPSQRLNENTRLSFTATATDGETPPASLTFSLEPGAPSGASILPDGRFRWRIREDQGPGQFNLAVRVTDSGNPPLSATTQFQVLVDEVNSPPIFNPRSQYTQVGQLLTFATATDGDIPPQELTFSLLPGAPDGVSVDRSTGVVRWQPAESQRGAFQLTVQARDNGVPFLTSVYTYSVTVGGSNEKLLVIQIFASGDRVSIHTRGIVGRTYQLQQSQTLVGATWSRVEDQLAVQEQIIFSDALIPGQARYYRLLELP